MVNTYLLKGNEVLIEAPGKANKNKIKNDLVWDLNEFLISKFDLYMFFTSRKTSDSFFCVPISKFFEKYLVFHKLDDMFIRRKTFSNEEFEHYRELMDPLKRMNDDVFRETCCMENVDIEYIAIEDISEINNLDKMYKSARMLKRKIATIFPVYVSLFGSREVRIVVNRKALVEPIKDVVKKHCVVR